MFALGIRHPIFDNLISSKRSPSRDSTSRRSWDLRYRYARESKSSRDFFVASALGYPVLKTCPLGI
jgi:hypothetical protein